MAKKRDEVVTRGMLDEAVEAIIEGVAVSIKESEQRLESRLEKKMDLHRAHTKDDIDGLKAELAKAPSRQEFEALKNRVQELEKLRLSN